MIKYFHFVQSISLCLDYSPDSLHNNDCIMWKESHIKWLNTFTLYNRFSTSKKRLLVHSVLYLVRSELERPEKMKMKWNESGFRPPLCTYRLNWARRTSWGWWDDWDDTVLQTQDSKFEPWRSEAEHATSRSRRLPTILTFTRGWGRNNFVSFKPPRPGTEPRTLAWKAAVLTTTLGPPPGTTRDVDKRSQLALKYTNCPCAKSMLTTDNILTGAVALSNPFTTRVADFASTASAKSRKRFCTCRGCKISIRCSISYMSAVIN